MCPLSILQYLGLIDTDEVLVPGGPNETLADLINKLEAERNVSRRYDAVSFMNMHYLAHVSESRPAEGKFIVDNRQRALRPLPHGETFI